MKQLQAHVRGQVQKGVLEGLSPEHEEQKIIEKMSEFTFVGHSGPVYSTSIMLDDKYMVSGSHDCTIRLWSLLSRQCLVVYQTHQMPVWSVRFSPLGYHFASASNDRTACVFDMRQHTPVRIFAGHLADVTAVEWHPNCLYIATGSSDCQLRIWSVETGECERAMFTCESAVRSLKFTRAGLHLFAGNDQGQFVLFDVQ